jgi:hypothetical protein
MECGTFVRATGIASLLGIGLLACSSSSGGGGAEAGTASVTGSFASLSFAPVDATAVVTTGSGGPAIDIYVSNRGSICGSLHDEKSHRVLVSTSLTNPFSTSGGGKFALA